MSSVTFLPVTDDDLLATWQHIATDNPIAADEYLDRIHHVCSLIADNPAIGVDRDELRDGVRSFPVENHVIFYLVKDEGITVLRVWSSAQDASTIDLLCATWPVLGHGNHYEKISFIRTSSVSRFDGQRCCEHRVSAGAGKHSLSPCFVRRYRA